ncbi:MAG: RdgB/HAM1 family non-canonical purine NTP pyrophosphatase [Flavobacteriales bacterium]|nr:RdgB/HAM1 family non-canonical purine NTP pyrophosphatase [Flavobacteriales bacterium]
MEGRTLVLCTANAGKVTEMRAMMPAGWQVLSLAEAGIREELPETGSTLEENALQKARTAHALCGLPCIADDTGLEVDALGGAPGVYSARYAGPERDDRANVRKLLDVLSGSVDRRAHFRTVIAWVEAGAEHLFEGRVDGSITTEENGAGGFGYDPVFRPEGSELTFAEMERGEKNAISHRGRAMARFAEWMKGR